MVKNEGSFSDVRNLRNSANGKMSQKRGEHFENEIIERCEYYRVRRMALIYKDETKMKIVQRGKIHHKCVFAQKSTVDFTGNYNGRHIAFEAKSTGRDFLPVSRIGDHQYRYLLQNAEIGGYSFVLCNISGFVGILRMWQLDRHVLNRRRIVPGDLRDVKNMDFLQQVKTEKEWAEIVAKEEMEKRQTNIFS